MIDTSTFFFDKERSLISFKGEVVVDISSVPQKAKTLIYSDVTIDFKGYNTELNLNASAHPFDIQITSFTPEDFIQAIVENRLEVEGMIVTEVLHKAYDYLWDNGFCEQEL